MIETSKRVRKWISRHYDRSVRIDYFPGVARGSNWAAVGWARTERKVLVSTRSGRTMEQALRRLMDDAEALDANR